MPELMRRSALQGGDNGLLHFVSGAMQLQVISGKQKLKLQVRPEDMDVPRLIADSLGVSLSATPMQPVTGDPMAFWCAPNEWILVGENISAAQYQAQLSSVLAGQSFVVTDLSDSLSVIELRGPHAIELLTEECGMDLHAATFNTGHSVLTRFASLPVILHKSDDNSCIHLYTDRSVARYLWDWLQEGIEKSGY